MSPEWCGAGVWGAAHFVTMGSIFGARLGLWGEPTDTQEGEQEVSEGQGSW